MQDPIQQPKHMPAQHPEWELLTDASQIDGIIATSATKPVAILKHSTRCGISAMAINGLKSNWDLPKDQVAFYYLDLLAYRAVSNAVAAQLGVPHQSPQLIVLRDGRVQYSASHHMIDYPSLKREVLAM